MAKKASDVGRGVGEGEGGLRVLKLISLFLILKGTPEISKKCSGTL